MNYYNEIDPYAAQWLRNLITAGHIPAGDVDERSIVDVPGIDLAGYTQCHFFAGIGGWSRALELAGWPADRPVWTGSCPCQPLSSAGLQRGHADERHLWPAFHSLIAECKPATVFGEQVASKDGREWLCGVRADLEAMGYAVGAADLCAAGVGAPHIRQRLWWVADTDGQRRDGQHALLRPEARGRDAANLPETAGSGESFWSAADFLPCTDGKARRVEPGTFPLAHGVPARVGRLRAYGNAIVPPLAAEFIAGYMGKAA